MTDQFETCRCPGPGRIGLSRLEFDLMCRRQSAAQCSELAVDMCTTYIMYTRTQKTDCISCIHVQYIYIVHEDTKKNRKFTLCSVLGVDMRNIYTEHGDTKRNKYHYLHSFVPAVYMWNIYTVHEDTKKQHI